MDDEKTNPVGAPTKYKPEMCAMLEIHLGQGFSFAAFTKSGVGRTTLYDWVDKYPEFKEAKERGTAAALSFYENLLRGKLTGVDVVTSLGPIVAKNIDTTLLIFTLKTRFHQTYGDRMKVDQKVNKTISIHIDSDDEGL